MKYIGDILIVLFLINTQEKQKVIFIFNTDAKNMKIKNGYYYIDDFSFKKVNNKSAKIVSFDFIKPNLKVLSEFKKMVKNKRQPYPEVFSEFELFLYVPRSKSDGCLIQVEKIWLVEDKIDN
ncbi:MAG TPA: hypothetical protein ENK46_13415 [Flavobacteriia bacterium]|nr:hypothetical protein [Flavobacteriia bacterium]